MIMHSKILSLRQHRNQQAKAECLWRVPYVYTKHKIEQEPEHDHWRETNPDLSRAPVLHQKQKDQNGAGDANYH
jgi:hypothetical protein